MAELPPPTPENPRALQTGMGDMEYRVARRELVADLMAVHARRSEMVVAIREQLGQIVNSSSLSNDIAAVRDQWAKRMTATYDRFVAEQMADYDAILRARMPAALGGDNNAMTAVLGVLDRRARLLGLDQPDRLVLAAAVRHTHDAQVEWDALPEAAADQRALEILAILADAGALVPVDGREGVPAVDRDVIDVA